VEIAEFKKIECLQGGSRILQVSEKWEGLDADCMKAWEFFLLDWHFMQASTGENERPVAGKADDHVVGLQKLVKQMIPRWWVSKSSWGHSKHNPLQSFKPAWSSNKSSNMPRSKKPGWIDWRSSAAREILLDDLLPPDGILFGKDHVAPEGVWDFYRTQEGFQDVVFDQFQERLKSHHKQVSKTYVKSHEEEAALARDRLIYPRQPTNNMGKLVFDTTPVRGLMREDVKHKRHVGLTPSQLQYIHGPSMAFSRPKNSNSLFTRTSGDKSISITYSRSVPRSARTFPTVQKWHSLSCDTTI
jgi:hypothetical protein